jgi:hypothetical protein
MQPTSHSHHKIINVGFGVLGHILDDMAPFDASDGRSTRMRIWEIFVFSALSVVSVLDLRGFSTVDTSTEARALHDLLSKICNTTYKSVW